MFQVPFEVLIRRQIARLLDPSLQCLRFVYDELVKVTYTSLVCCALMSSAFVLLCDEFQDVEYFVSLQMSRACEATELQRFPFLRKCMDEIMGKFLRDGVKPAERMIVNLIEMEVI